MKFVENEYYELKKYINKGHKKEDSGKNIYCVLK